MDEDMEVAESEGRAVEVTERDEARISHGEFHLTFFGEYARRRLIYLKKHRQGLYRQLVLEKKLTSHLKDIQKRSDRALGLLMEQLNDRDPPPDRDVDYMKWVGHMNMTKLLAEEVIDRRIIYVEEYPDD